MTHPPLSRRARLALAGAAGTAVVAIALVAGSTGVADEGKAIAGSATDATPPPVASVLGVFRVPAVPADTMPGDTAEALKQSGDAQPGEDPSESRRIDLGGRPVYLWKMHGGVCFTSPGGDGCVPIQHIVQRGISLSVSGELRRSDMTYEHATLFGIVHDGVDVVRVAKADGSEIEVPVKENVFAVQLEDVPAAVRWDDADGPHREPAPGQLSPEQRSQLLQVPQSQ
jgi:hypothetical protein